MILEFAVLINIIIVHISTALTHYFCFAKRPDMESMRDFAKYPNKLNEIEKKL